MMTIRLGILGAAGIAPATVVRPARRRRDVEVVAIASRRSGAAADFATEHAIPVWFEGYEALLADPRIDAVYVALPPSEHAEWAIRALEAGKHVLCEKPAAMNAAEAHMMVQAAQRADRRLIEGFHDYHHPLTAALLDVIASGELGEVESIEGTLSASIPFREDSIRHDPRLGGGALMDLGCYPVHWLRTLLGEEPEVVEAIAGLNELGADHTIEARLAFPSGAVGLIRASMEVTDFVATVRVRGSRATLTAGNMLHPHNGHSVRIESTDAVPMMFTVGGAESYDHQLEQFVEAVSGGNPVATEGADIVDNMTLIDAIYRAAGVRRDSDG